MFASRLCSFLSNLLQLPLRVVQLEARAWYVWAAILWFGMQIMESRVEKQDNICDDDNNKSHAAACLFAWSRVLLEQANKLDAWINNK